jgi:hypothetical protein
MNVAKQPQPEPPAQWYWPLMTRAIHRCCEQFLTPPPHCARGSAVLLEAHLAIRQPSRWFRSAWRRPEPSSWPVPDCICSGLAQESTVLHIEARLRRGKRVAVMATGIVVFIHSGIRRWQLAGAGGLSGEVSTGTPPLRFPKKRNVLSVACLWVCW